MEIGIKHTLSLKVTPELTARTVGSGLLPVFATPMLLALSEACCCEAIADQLEEGTTTVGTLADIRHTAATPVGMTVTCECELVEIDRRRLVFRVTLRDEAGEVGGGTHERFIVNAEKFMAKAEARANLG